MRLHSSYTSPYVRKVKIMLHEIGLWDQVDERFTNPAEEDVLRPLNPLGKIPAMEFPDLGAVYDSPVICEVLDRRHDRDPRIPADEGARIAVLRTQALADGLADAANLRRNEALRPTGSVYQPFVDRQDLAIKNGLLALDAAFRHWSTDEEPLLDQIATGAAVGYIRFRYQTLPWRDHCPHLAEWEERFFARPSAIATEPTNPPGRPAPPEQSPPPRW